MIASKAPAARTGGGAAVEAEAAVTAATDMKNRGLCLEEYLEAMEESEG